MISVNFNFEGRVVHTLCSKQYRNGNQVITVQILDEDLREKIGHFIFLIESESGLMPEEGYYLKEKDKTIKFIEIFEQAYNFSGN